MGTTLFGFASKLPERRTRTSEKVRSITMGGREKRARERVDTEEKGREGKNTQFQTFRQPDRKIGANHNTSDHTCQANRRQVLLRTRRAYWTRPTGIMTADCLLTLWDTQNGYLALYCFFFFPFDLPIFGSEGFATRQKGDESTGPAKLRGPSQSQDMGGLISP